MMLPLVTRLSLVPTRWFSEDVQQKHREDNVVIYGIAGLPRYRAGDVRRDAQGSWELWLTDATGVSGQWGCSIRRELRCTPALRNI